MRTHQLQSTCHEVSEQLFHRFDRIGHRLGQGHRDAIDHLITTMGRCYFGMMSGQDAKRAYLSSLAPGIGKSSTLKAFLSQVAKYDDGRGCLVCLGTVDEIVDFANDLDPDTLSIWVGLQDEHRVEHLFNRDRSEAKVLITTHKRLELEFAKTDGTKNIVELTDLLYQGRVRPLRVWDEAFLPGYEVTLSIDHMQTLAGILRGFDRRLSRDILVFLDGLRSTEERTKQIKVPGMFAEVSVEKANEWLDEQRVMVRAQQAKDFLAALHYCSGKTVAMRRSQNGSTHVLTFRPTIHPSFNPLIILDASGRKGYRKIYDEMVERGRIVRLEHEDKLYEGFAIDVWPTGGGKDAFKKDWDALVAGIARWISLLPRGDKCLVIHHLPDASEDVALWKSKYRNASYMRDFEQGLKDYMQENYPFFDLDRLAFTTWGKHRARNAWAEFSAVVAAGTLFKPDAVYEAQYRIAKRYLPQDGLVHTTTLRDFRLGEYCDDLIQGLGRIRIRSIDTSNPRSAPPAKALVVAAERSIPFDCYGLWFPGATVRRWDDVKKVRGRAAGYVEKFEEWSKGRSYGAFLPDAAARKLLGLESKQYHNQVGRNQSLQTKLRTLNVVRVKGGWQFTLMPFASERELQKERRS